MNAYGPITFKRKNMTLFATAKKNWWGTGWTNITDAGFVIRDPGAQMVYVHAVPWGLGICPTLEIECFPEGWLHKQPEPKWPVRPDQTFTRAVTFSSAKYQLYT